MNDSKEMKMEGDKTFVTLAVPRPEKRVSVTSSKFEIRRPSDPNSTVKGEGVKQSKLCYRLADMIFMMVVIFPLSIGFWRGVWQLMDFYSDFWSLGPWLSLGVGYSIPLVLYLYQEPLKRHVIPGQINFITFYIISRTLLLVHAFGSVNQWRGLWKLIDDQTGLGPISALVCLILGVIFSFALKTFSNVLAAPLMCCVDEAFSIHDCTLRFKTKPVQQWRYFWDCLFSVFVIPSLTVLCWRGVWNMADFYLYPEDAFMSAMTSLVFGYVLCIILISLQPLICDFVCTLKGLVRLTVIDLSYTLGFIGCVFAWRGVWNSYNLFIIFDTPYVSEWVTAIVGAFGTMILGCISTVMARGIVIDGDMDDEDEAAEWLIPYFSHLRTKNDETPFPEPWIGRAVFTKQKLNFDKMQPISSRRPNCKRKANSDYVETYIQPLKKTNNCQNSIHPITSGNEEGMQQITPRVQLNQIPHIDSSSDEDFGGGETLSPAELNQDNQLDEVVTKKDANAN